MWMEKSLIGMSAWQGLEKDFSYQCQELGESTEKFSSHMAHAEPLSPSPSLVWLILFSPSCLSLFPSTDTRTTPTAASGLQQGRQLPQVTFQLLHLFLSPFLASTLAFASAPLLQDLTAPRLRQPCAMATATLTTTMDYNSLT